MEHYGVNTIIATSLSDAKTIISTTELGGMFIISDWVGTNDDATIDGIMPNDLPIPTITFVPRSSDYLWMNAFYKRPQHEYITIPWDIEEVLTMIRVTGMITEKELNTKDPLDIAQVIQTYNQSLLDAINTAYESGAYPDDLTSSARRQHHRRMIEGEW